MLVGFGTFGRTVRGLHFRWARRFVKSVMSASLATVAASSSAAVTTPTPTANAVPRIAFEQTTHDFGVVKRGEIVKHSFVYTNTGTETLEVLAVKPGCGCTSAGTWEREVPPGKTGSIPLQFNSTGFSGNVTKSVTVTFKDTAQSNMVLFLKAKVWTPIEITPATVLFQYGEGSTNVETRTVRIINNLETPLTLDAPQVSNPSFKAALKTITPGKEFSLEISTAPPMPSSTFTAQIILKTSSPEMPTLTIHSTGIQRASVTYSPTRLMLPASPLSSNLKLGMTIQSHDTSALALSEPSCTIPGVTVDIREMQAGRLFYVSAAFPAGFTPKAGETPELTVRTSHPKFPMIKVPIAVMGVAAATPAALTPVKSSVGPVNTPTRPAFPPIPPQSTH